MITQIPTGAFADIFGRRASLALGNLFMALPMFLIALYPEPWIMIPYSLMWGLGRSLTVGTDRPILFETLQQANQEHRYQKILGNTTIFFQISAAISILAGGYLFQIAPTLPYYASGLASLIGLFTAFLFIEPKRVEKFKAIEFIATNIAGFREIFKCSYMRLLTVLYVLIFGVASANQQFFMQPYMVELGMNDIQRSWVAMIIKVSIAFAGTWIVSRKIAKHRAFILFIPILMILSLLPAKFVSLPYALILFVGIAFASGNKNVFFEPEITRNLSAKVRSTALSAQRMLSSLVSAVVQLISGPIILSKSIGMFYTYLGVFSLIVILPLGVLVMSQRDKMR